MSGEEFENKCKRDQGRCGVDVSEDTNHCIYSKSLPWLNSIFDHSMSNLDIEQVNLNLMSTE